jgi:hypothetical protein
MKTRKDFLILLFWKQFSNRKINECQFFPFFYVYLPTQWYKNEIWLEKASFTLHLTILLSIFVEKSFYFVFRINVVFHMTSLPYYIIILFLDYTQKTDVFITYIVACFACRYNINKSKKILLFSPQKHHRNFVQHHQNHMVLSLFFLTKHFPFLREENHHFPHQSVLYTTAHIKKHDRFFFYKKNHKKSTKSGITKI